MSIVILLARLVHGETDDAARGRICRARLISDLVKVELKRMISLSVHRMPVGHGLNLAPNVLDF
jgi:predicted methyltransferase MtxX (methanogen marker protein 4)